MTTQAMTTRATTLDRLETTTPLAPPMRVDATELAGSVVLLAPGRRLVVSHDAGARWHAVVDDPSVASVHTAEQGGYTAVVCSVDAVAHGRTRGSLLDASGKRHLFEVIVMDLHPHAQTLQPPVLPSVLPSVQPWFRAAPSSRRSQRSSWGARLHRGLMTAGRAQAAVASHG